MTRRKTNRLLAAALALSLGLAVGAVLLFSSVTPVAVTRAGPLGQGGIDTVAIDTDPSGNTASALGSREACRQVAPGATFDVDITIDAIPAVADMNDALAGIQFVLRYDSQLLTLNKADRGFILTDTAGSSLFPPATSTPAELDAGPPQVVAFGNLDTGLAPTAEHGIRGVAARLTFTASASSSGVAEIILLKSFDPLAAKIIQVDNDNFSIGEFVGGAIAVSPAGCSGVAVEPTTVPPPGTAPPPDTAPAPSDTTPQPGTTPDRGGTPAADTTPGVDTAPSLTPTPAADGTPPPAATQTAVAQATAEASADGNGDDGGIGWLPILIIVLVVVAGSLAAGGWALRRRFRT